MEVTMTPALARPERSDSPTTSGRLRYEFAALSPDQVDRCVTDTRACVAHLGIDPTPETNASVRDNLGRPYYVAGDKTSEKAPAKFLSDSLWIPELVG
jgi:hypothetical protein